MVEKRCSTCGEGKLLTEFHRDKSGKCGLTGSCKACACRRAREWARANPERKRASSRARYYADLEGSRAEGRARAQANPGKARARAREWRQANREKHRAYSRGWARANRARSHAQVREWRAANPEAYRLQGMLRRARERANGIFKVTAKEVRRMLAKPCYLCGVAPSADLEHIVPVSRGGQHSIGNLLGACKPCNNRKHDKLLVEYRRYQRAKGPQ